MDSIDEDASFELYTIKNDETEAIVNLQEILNIPSAISETTISESPNTNAALDNGNKQVFYLTFDNGAQNTQYEDSLLEFKEDEEQTDLFNDDLKLITLDDGRMFMATDQSLGCVDNSDLLIDNESLMNLQPHEEEELIEQPLLNDQTTIRVTNEDSSSAESVLEKNADVNYQLVKLADGTQALIKIYKINTTETVPGAALCIQHIGSNKEDDGDEEFEDEEEPPKKIKKFKCLFEGCNKFYATSYHLTVHIRSHTDCKPYACTIDGCEKKFSTNYSLKAHTRTHTGEKPYGCQVCSKEFKTSGDLQKHVRIHTGEKPFLCPIEGCGKSFTTSNIRKVHIRSHTGERPYSCPHPNCGKAFTSSTNYKNHIRIHSGEKPYACQVEGCGKRFTEYSSLYKHNAVHQPVRPYSCVFCAQKFKQESALNFHKRLKHNVVVTKDGTEIIVKIE